MAIVGLNRVNIIECGLSACSTHVQLPLELPVASQLHKNNFVEQQSDKVEGLGDVAGLVGGVCHLGDVRLV